MVAIKETRHKLYSSIANHPHVESTRWVGYRQWMLLLGLSIPLLLLFCVGDLNAAVLSDERADQMYHMYDGGGVKITGPAFLVRKNFEEKVSLSASYYVDNISSASIDVITSASKYSEYREETGLGLDYLYRDITMSLVYTKSDESDYDATTTGFNFAQEVFGGLTTISMGYAHGSDIVGRSDEPSFGEDIDRDHYSLGISQILTKNTIFSTGYEAISDQGFLNNPYRGVRIGGPSTPVNADEIYPRTRRSHAASLDLVQNLFGKSAVRLRYRYFWDTWDIQADNYEISYSRYLGARRWLLDIRYRYYDQSKASFYSDYFPVEQTYMARDKELSTFSSQSIGLHASYKFLNDSWWFMYKGTANLSYERIMFDYKDFTDIRIGESSYGKPYSFDANVVGIFFSFWY